MERLYDWVCEECGKIKQAPNTTYVYNSFRYYVNGKVHMFCSENCYKKYLSEHRICYQCGKHLNKPMILGWTNDMSFCSEDCKNEYAKSKGMLHTCENCGKYFIRKKGWFCSQKCSRDAKKNGWVKTNPGFDDVWF